MKKVKQTLCLILSAILIIGAMPFVTSFADSKNLTDGVKALEGHSIMRLTPTEATFRLRENYGGQLIYAITDTAEVPDFTETDVWTEIGGVTENSTTIWKLNLNKGAQYVHFAVQVGDVYSEVLTNVIPCNSYIYEDFDSYAVGMSTKDEVNYLPLYRNPEGSVGYGGQANEIVSVNTETEGVISNAFCVHGANDAKTGSSDQRMTLPVITGGKITVEFDAVQQASSGAGEFGIYTQDNMKILNIQMDSPFAASNLSNSQRDELSESYAGTTQTGRHHFKVELDTVKGIYDYYIDGNKANTKTLYANLQSAPSFIKFYAANLKAGTAYDNIEVKIEENPAVVGKGIYRTATESADIYFKSSCTGNVYYTVSTDESLPTAEEIKENGIDGSITAGTNSISLTGLEEGEVCVNLTVENSAGQLSEVAQFNIPYDSYIYEDNESYNTGITPSKVVRKYNVGSTQYENTEINNRVFRANGGYGYSSTDRSVESIALPTYTVETGKSLFILEADIIPISGDPGSIFFGKTGGTCDYVAGVSFSASYVASIGAKTNHTSAIARTYGQKYHIKIEYDASTKLFNYYIDGEKQNSTPLESNANFDPTGINIYTGTYIRACVAVDNIEFYISDGFIHNHSFTKYIYNEDATCLKAGTKTAKCDLCDLTDTVADENNPKLEHSYTGKIKANGNGTHSFLCVNGCEEYGGAVECSGGTATCTAQAVCSECNTAYGDKDYSNHSTTETVLKNAMAVTCRQDGYTGDKYCKACDRLVEEGSAISRIGVAHSWNEGEITTPAGCTAKGTETFTCTVCGITKTEDIEATGHTVVDDAAVEPTCTTDGKTAGTHCSVCKTVITEQQTVKALGHDWDEGEITTPATCTTNGIRTYKCNRSCCSAIKTENIDALGHNIITHIEKKPTCTDNGWNSYNTCSRCDYSTYLEIEATGHSFTNYVSNNDATCTADGTKTAKCDKCDVTNTVTDVGSATGHIEVYDKAVAATCTTTGLTAGKHCSVCNNVLTEQKTVPALGHKFDSGKITKAATCKATGVKTYTCTVCKATKTVTIAKSTTHTYKNVVTAATLTKAGKVQSKCSVCGKIAKTTAIANIASVKLSKTAYIYTGKALKPTVTVKDSNGKVIKATYYTVTYKNNINAGKATVTVKFRGNYSGTKTLTFTISPKATSLSKVISTKKATATVTVKKQATQTTGYEIQYSTSAKFTAKTTKTVKITSAKILIKTISKLTSGKTYYFRVRTYKTVSKTNYYSEWSKTVSTKIK